MGKMLKKSSWKAFQESGMLWFVNRILHTFGWAITLQVEKDGTISDAYPARCKFRGFPLESEEKGFKRVTRFMYKQAKRLLREVEE